MKALRVVGMGPGGPDQLTVEAVTALREVDVFLVPVKDGVDGGGTDDLVALRRAILDRHTDGAARVVEVPDPPRDRSEGSTADTEAYERVVHDWHDARAQAFEEAVDAHVPEDGVAGLLVWGDPALYDSTLRVIALMQTPVEVTVIPGITAPQTLAAAHAVTWNRIGGPVHVTTGRRLREEGMTASDVLVMLDSQNSFLTLDPAIEIYWGAYLGTPDEILLSGTVGSVGSQIEKVRAEARAEHGWIMDTYLLRQP